MAWYEYVNCPYCEYEMQTGNEDFEGTDDIDVECEACEKEFTIVREWTPSFSTQEIFYYECEECGKEDRDDNMFRVSDTEHICKSCYFKKEIDKISK